jgi:hypothetical protein
LGQNLVEERRFLGRTEAEQARPRAIDEQGNGDVAGRDNRIIGLARNPQPVELGHHNPAWIGRIGHEHDLSAFRAKPAQRLGGFLERRQPIVEDAPDVA